MFHRQAQAIARGMGLPGISLAGYPGAIETHSHAELRANIAGLFDTMVEAWTKPAEAGSVDMSAADSGEVAISGSFEEVNDFFYEKGWTDGLLIVPPTSDKVGEMLRWTDRDPDETIATLPIAYLNATPRTVAINAVMAGCRPEYLPVLIAAVEAMADPDYQLKDLNTTGSIKPFILVNGPVVKELDINAGTSLMAPGRRSNSTIGRAIGLIIRNIAGFREGETSNGCFGWPGTPWVMAEDEDNSPWLPYHVDRGFAAESSTVTAMMMISMTNQAMTAGDTPEPHLTGLCRKLEQSFTTTAMQMGAEHNNYLVFVSPANAQIIAKGYSKQEVKKYLAENAKITVERINEEFNLTFADNKDSVHSMAKEGRIPQEWDREADEYIPFVPSSDVIHVVVCGSAQRNRNVAMRAAYCTPVTREVKFPGK